MRSFAAAAVIKAITALVTGPPNLVGFDFADLRLPCIDRVAPCSGQGEAAGPDRKKRIEKWIRTKKTAPTER